MSEGTQRKLAAIVSADVVGFSRLMGADEEGALAALKAHLGEVAFSHSGSPAFTYPSTKCCPSASFWKGSVLAQN